MIYLVTKTDGTQERVEATTYVVDDDVGGTLETVFFGYAEEVVAAFPRYTVKRIDPVTDY